MNTCAFDRGLGCSALTEKKCRGCSFRKSEEQLKNDRAAALKRIEKLHNYKDILKKYY